MEQRLVPRVRGDERVWRRLIILRPVFFTRPKTTAPAEMAQPVSAGTTAFSVTNQVRPFSSTMTLRAGAFAFANR